MKKIIVIGLLVYLAGCLAAEEEITEPIEEADRGELAILIVPTSVNPNEEFDVTWVVNLEGGFDTGIVYDVATQSSDYYAYEFTADIFSSNASGSFSTTIVAFEEGQMYMRPYATSNGQLFYGEEVAVPIVMNTN